MANERHGLAACIYIDGAKLEVASGWSIGIAGEECEVVRFEDTWKQLLRGVLVGAGSITAYHDQDAKVLAELAQSSTTKALILYPDCTDDSTYYTFDAWFDFEHTADVGACQEQTSPFRVDGTVNKVGWECMLLKDSFSVTEGAPMAIPHTCFPGPGILIFDQTDGNFLTTGGEFFWPVQAGVAVWGDQEFYATTDASAAFTRELGQVLKFRVSVTTADEVLFGYNVDTTPTDESESEYCIRALGASAGFDVHWGAGPAGSSPVLKDIWPALAGDVQIAIVLSPFDVSAFHYYPDTALTSAYGAHYYFRDESETYPHARLAWYTSAEHTGPLYPMFSNLDSAGTMDYVLIPCDTYEQPLLVPIAMDLFAGASPLATHSMDYGGFTYVEHTGSWTVGSGVASPDATVDAVGTYPSLTPDVWHEADVYIPAASAAPIGLAIRKSADTAGGENEWRLTIQGNTGGNDTLIDEVIDSAVTNRAAADDDWADDTTYKLKVRAYDEEITLYVDNVEVANYASAWAHKHATWHGVYADNDADATFDELLTLPIGSGLERLCYDSFDQAENLNVHVTDEGALAWIIDVGTWADDGAEADPDATANAHCHVVTSEANAWVGARVFVDKADEWAGIKVRQSADTMGGANFWYATIGDRAGNDEEIGDCIDGSYTQRAAADTDNYPSAARYYVDVRALDNDIRMWVEGADELGYASAGWNNDAVWHGLYNSDSTDAKFDQFRVTKINTYGEYDPTLDGIN